MIRFKRSVYDAGLFFLLNKEGKLIGIVGLHVDDFLTCGDKMFKFSILPKLLKHFQVGKSETSEFMYTGFKIFQTNSGIKLDQVDYVTNITVPMLDAERLKQWDYFTFNLTEVSFLKSAWDAGTKLEWRIVLHFEVKSDGMVSIDQFGPCALEEVYFPEDDSSGKMIGSCFRVQSQGNARYFDLDDICLASSSQGSVRASFSRRDPEFHLLEAYIDFYFTLECMFHRHRHICTLEFLISVGP